MTDSTPRWMAAQNGLSTLSSISPIAFVRDPIPGSPPAYTLSS